MTRLYTDGASGTLLAQVLPADLVITLNAGQGATFPSPTGGDHAILTLEDNAGNKERVRLTQRVADTLTIVRAQEGTIALTFPATTSRCELRVTASAMSEFVQRTGDDIDTELFFSVAPVLDNDVSLLGEQVDDTRRSLVKVNTSDEIELGDANNATKVKGTSTEIDNPTTISAKLTQSAGGANPVNAFSAAYGVEIEANALAGAWQLGVHYFDNGVITGGMGAVGIAGGGLTRMVLGVGATWWDGATALTLESVFDLVDGLQYAGNTIWHDGNFDRQQTIATNWVIDGVWTFNAAPLIGTGSITSSPDNSVLYHIALTQAAYDALTPDGSTLYYITD